MPAKSGWKTRISVSTPSASGGLYAPSAPTGARLPLDLELDDKAGDAPLCVFGNEGHRSQLRKLAPTFPHKSDGVARQG